MRSFVFILVIAIACASIVSADPVSIPLGSCSSFALMAGTEITAAGEQTTIHTGSIGVAPGTSITGNIVVSDGAVENDSTASIACAADELIAYAALQNAPCGTVLASDDLGGVTFQPGTYCTASGLTITSGFVTLDALGDASAQFIFQSATTLITSTATSFILVNGAQAANVYWSLGSMASIASSSSIVGNIFAGTAVTFDVSATHNGRVFAQSAITFAGTNSVTMPASSASSVQVLAPSVPVATPVVESVVAPAPATVAPDVVAPPPVVAQPAPEVAPVPVAQVQPAPDVAPAPLPVASVAPAPVAQVVSYAPVPVAPVAPQPEPLVPADPAPAPAPAPFVPVPVRQKRMLKVLQPQPFNES